MQKIFSFFLKGIAITAISTAFVLVLGKSLKKEEKRECFELRSQQKEAPAAFYLTPEQKKQCDALNIKISAPIKRVSI